MPPFCYFVFPFRKTGAVLALLLVCLLTGCYAPVFTGLTEVDANEMVALLRNNSIDARKTLGEKELWIVEVPDALFARSVDMLRLNGFPRTTYDTRGSVFKKSGMVSTPTEEQARLLYALSQELAGTIAQIDGVLSARVQIVLAENDTFGKKLSEASASVFIRHRADVDMETDTALIKKMVENSIRDLKYDAISVYLSPSKTTLPPAPHPAVGLSEELWWAITGGLTFACFLIFFLLFRRGRRKIIEQGSTE